MTIELTGIHHLTAVSSQIRQNKQFYTGTLGMRLVKRTVNQDDTSAHHLFYADRIGTPGTDMTFFDWNAPRERRGNHSVTQTALRVLDDASLNYWLERFAELQISNSGIIELDGRQQITFEDPEGQRLALIPDAGAGDAPVAWEGSPVPAAHQIRGLGPITMSVPQLAPTDHVLQTVMNLRPVREYTDPDNARNTVHVYEMGQGGTHAELHVAVRPELPVAQPGAGGVHHVAFRVPDADYDAWAEHLMMQRVANSGKVDRYYFRSLYFREPNGVLFELASDGPGFGVDEPLETLGEETILPPFLEPQREQILAGLKPLD